MDHLLPSWTRRKVISDAKTREPLTLRSSSIWPSKVRMSLRPQARKHPSSGKSTEGRTASSLRFCHRTRPDSVMRHDRIVSRIPDRPRSANPLNGRLRFWTSRRAICKNRSCPCRKAGPPRGRMYGCVPIAAFKASMRASWVGWGGIWSTNACRAGGIPEPSPGTCQVRSASRLALGIVFPSLFFRAEKSKNLFQ